MDKYVCDVCGYVYDPKVIRTRRLLGNFVRDLPMVDYPEAGVRKTCFRYWSRKRPLWAAFICNSKLLRSDKC